MNPTHWLGQFTRWLQSTNPDKPIGISTLSRKFATLLPEYSGVIQLEDGLYFDIDTKHAPERAIFFVGDRHRVITALMRRRVKPGAFCMDIGANVGFYTLKLALLAGKQGQVAAFEANPYLVERIKHNINLNGFGNIDLVNKAISHHSGTTEFYIAPNSELSSLEYIADANEMLHVEGISIDEYLEIAQWQRLDFIKLDIEGHDCQALLGAKHSLQRFMPDIVMEYHYYTDKTIADEVFRYLKSLGYTLSGLTLRTAEKFAFDWKQAPNEKMLAVNIYCQAPDRV
jgi:FkbM family methyltransferase